MTSSAKLTKNEIKLQGKERQKRLGQYFTGVPLGRLLAYFAKANTAKTIIDPMAGNGDLLEACLSLGSKAEHIAGIDIDPIASKECQIRLPNALCLLGSAFSQKTLLSLPRTDWELVITNPPYVRYQSLSSSEKDEIEIPNAIEVRNDLLNSLEGMISLDSADKDLFRYLVSSYSGLADLAIPSWILCAALVQPGGRLALVAPESWMSREYAVIVRYLLLKWFHIEYLIEDEHACWFSGTDVKTNLIIAKRIKRRKDAFIFEHNDSYMRVRISGEATGPTGPLHKLFPSSKNKEKKLAAEIGKLKPSAEQDLAGLAKISHLPLSRLAKNVKTLCSTQKWCEGTPEAINIELNTDHSLPTELAHWYEGKNKSQLATIKSLGVKIGQGLRTGANGFFYADIVSHHSGYGVSQLEWTGRLRAKATLPESCAIPVIRRQSELPNGLAVKSSILSGRTIYLKGFALPEEFSGDLLPDNLFKVMPEEMAEVIRAALKTNFGKPNNPKRIYELSAVATNIRNGNFEKGIFPQFWYQLPEFAPRHKPDLLMPRVNNKSPKTYINIDRSSLVDANFSTFWLEENATIDAYALLAILNSSWCKAVLELSASTMGAGALKVESAHLKRLPIPHLTAEYREELSKLGKELATENQVTTNLTSIDILMTKVLLGQQDIQGNLVNLRGIVEESRDRRRNH